MIAFIFSSRRDAPAARLCAESLSRFPNVESRIVFDIADSDLAEEGDLVSDFPRNGRLFGMECAAGIADLIAANSNGHDVVAKVDADTRLTSAGVEWLEGATRKARGFHLPKISKWSGIWSAPASVMVGAGDKFRAATKCEGCPEAHLFWSLFKRWTGIERAPAEALHIWRGGQIPDGVFCVTLPSALNSPTRALACSRLFGLTKKIESRTLYT